MHSLRIRGAEQNSNFDESITDGSRKVKSPAQQSVNKKSSLEPVKLIQPMNGEEKKTPYTVTAFICGKGYKNGDTLSFDDKIPEATPESATASSPNTNIPIISKNVNAKFSAEAQRANMR